MAIDYGDARTGVAFSDLSRTIAGEVFVIAEEDRERLAARIAEEARNRGVSDVALGFPRNMDGTLGPRAQKTEEFAVLLRSHSLNVTLWDERRTTADAERILSERGVRGKKRKSTVDAVAAALILEGYLSKF